MSYRGGPIVTFRLHLGRSSLKPRFVTSSHLCGHHNLGMSSNHHVEQVIAPLLIVLRVANRKALTSEAIVSGNIGSIRFRSQGESADDSGTVAYEYPTGSVGTDGGNPSGLPDGSEDTIGKAIDEVPL